MLNLCVGLQQALPIMQCICRASETHGKYHNVPQLTCHIQVIRMIIREISEKGSVIR